MNKERPPNPNCQYCYGSGHRFFHSDDCGDELCALNGDMHSCAGKLEPCPCALSSQHCDLGVGCEETGACYAEAHGEHDRCGRPTQELQPTFKEIAERQDAEDQIERLSVENHALRERNKALLREATTWNAALTSVCAQMELLRKGHPRLEVRYWTGAFWDPLYGVRLDECLAALLAAPKEATK